MTRPAPTPEPAAPPATAPVGSAAASWPRFVPRCVETGSTGHPEITFPCAACGEWGAVDESLGLCRPCWRGAALVVEVLRGMRDEEGR
jgi:hypothetical protein